MAYKKDHLLNYKLVSKSKQINIVEVLLFEAFFSKT